MKALKDKLCVAIVIAQEQWQKIERAEVVCEEFAVLFLSFCAKNYQYGDGKWFDAKGKNYNESELLKIFRVEN